MMTNMIAYKISINKTGQREMLINLIEGPDGTLFCIQDQQD